jgi:predicted DNA-binding transcriptional regulator YafY
VPSVPPRRRADRLDLIARLLADRPGLTTAALARELDVSVRSIFRDLQTLRDRGYPVEGARGRGGGLRLPANWGLGKVLFSRDEALCTLLALAIADRLGLPMFAPELGRARRKITGAFSRTERRRIAPLRERIFVGPVASPAVRGSYAEPLPAPMRRLQVAFVEERVVRAEYRKEGGASSVRRLEPHALVINWPAWYVLGYDHSRAQTRTFRLDRFLAVEIESEPFRPRAHSLVEEVLSSAGVPLERV